jgi:hypothetical protein
MGSPGARFSSSAGIAGVGVTPIVMVSRGSRGRTSFMRKRLQNHLHGASSFTHTHLSGHGAKLRHGYAFRCLAVKRARQRALLEFYATGWLCPAHLGTHVGDD